MTNQITVKKKISHKYLKKNKLEILKYFYWVILGLSVKKKIGWLCFHWVILGDSSNHFSCIRFKGRPEGQVVAISRASVGICHNDKVCFHSFIEES